MNNKTIITAIVIIMYGINPLIELINASTDIVIPFIIVSRETSHINNI